jgi:hypothetical protein
MARRTLPGITLSANGAPVELETIISPVSAYVVCLSCAAPGLTVGLHSAYVGEQGAQDTAIARLVMSRHDTTARALTCSSAELPVTHARERLLLDHLAAFRELLSEEDADVISIDVDDRALALAADTY